MLAAAVVDLGLQPSQFWELTPRAFDVMLQRLAVREGIEAQRHSVSTAILCAMYANTHQDPNRPGSKYEPKDFLPALNANGKPKTKQHQTPEEMTALLKVFVAGMTGYKARPN